MSLVARGLVCAGLLALSSRAHAETPAASAPAASAPAASPVAAESVPAKTAPVRVYMRSENEPLTFVARAENSRGAPNVCSAPCDAGLLPGDYELKLNGVLVNGPVELQKPGTLHGELHSHAGARAGAWLGLNVGGILGGVFITVAALGGPSWAYIAGGGSLAAGGLIFVVAYRGDRATVSFTPGMPNDMRGMPVPEAAGAALQVPDRASFGSQARGLGFRVEF